MNDDIRILYVLKHAGRNPWLYQVKVKPWGKGHLTAADKADLHDFDNLLYRKRVDLPNRITGIGRTISTFYGFNRDQLLAHVAEVMEGRVAQQEKELEDTKRERDTYLKWLSERTEE